MRRHSRGRRGQRAISSKSDDSDGVPEEPTPQRKSSKPDRHTGSPEIPEPNQDGGYQSVKTRSGRISKRPATVAKQANDQRKVR